MKYPEKWRETVDVRLLPFRKISIIALLGYPHAGNDVFHVSALFEGEEITAFIKVERQLGANIANEVRILSAISASYAPVVLEYSLSEPSYIVTKEVAGERLSTIIDDDRSTNIEQYLFKQAALLSDIHRLRIPCEPVKDRRFFHIPPPELRGEHGTDAARIFLTENAPVHSSKCFVHGDYHYANILWRNGDIVGVLDYELSGIGVREFDMAWSVFLRPGQRFLKTWHEVEAFLQGYQNPFSLSAFTFYYVQIAAHFYPMGDEEYKADVRKLIGNAISKHNLAKTTL